MRKNDKRQQRGTSEQGDLFGAPPDVHGTDGIGSVQGRKAELLSRLKSQRALTGQLSTQS